MIVASEVLSKLKHDGVVLLPSILSRADVLVMRPLLNKAVHSEQERWGNKPGYIDHWMVQNLMLHGEPFLRLLENPVIHAYLSEVLSNTCILYAFTSSSMPPAGSNYSRRIHTDSPRVIPGYWTNAGVMVALDDFTDENGVTEFLPCSQERVEPPSESEFAASAVRLYPKAGDGIMFNARVWHRGGINKTDHARHAVTMNVCRSYMKQRFDYPRLLPQSMIAAMGPVGRRFIGMDTRVPSSLDEYYVPAEERLYKAGQG